MTKKKEIEFWEVTITCLVRKQDINGRTWNQNDIKDITTIEFDQTDHEDLKITVK